MKTKKLLSAMMAGLMLSSALPINVLADTSGIVNNLSAEDTATSEGAVSVSESKIDVDFAVTGQWEGGFNGEITITNLTDTMIENWQIEMEFPQEITNIWNAAIVSHEGMVYNIKNAGGSNSLNIPAGGSVTFGFTGTCEKEIANPENVKLVTGKSDADNESYSVNYTLLSDWGSGYSAQITITNNTDKPMEAWHLEFDFDREIESIWNAVIKEHTAGKYHVSNAEYNSVIPANGSISFGFNGSGGNFENKPSNYLLNTYDASDTVDVKIESDEIINADYYNTDIIYVEGDYEDSVTKDLILPQVGAYNGSSITWSSSNESLVESNGKVNRPTEESQYVTLTATITDDYGEYIQKHFDVKIIKKFVEKDLEMCSLENLKVINGGQMPYIRVDSVTNNICMIEGKYTNYTVESPEEAIYSLNALKDLYGIKSPKDEYVFLEHYDLGNRKRIRLQQVYNGIPVLNAHLVVTADNEGNLMSINGEYYNIGDIDVTPFSTPSEIYDSIHVNEPHNIEKSKLCIYNKDGEFILCWIIENTNNCNTYIVQDGTLDVVDVISNYQDANNMSGEYYEVKVSKNGSINDDTHYDGKYNILTYVFDSDKGKNIIADNFKLFPLPVYGTTNKKINFSKVNYGTDIESYELYDTYNNIRVLFDNGKLHTIEYKERDKYRNYYDMGLSAMYNAHNAINFFRSIGLKDSADVNGRISINIKRPLYIIIKDSLVNDGTGSIAAYSYSDRALFLGVDDRTGYKSSSHYDIVVHEMVHGLLYNKFCIINTKSNEEVNILHESYGDIFACLANCEAKVNNNYEDNWYFSKDYKASGNGSRNIANPSSRFYTNYNAYCADRQSKAIDSHDASTILSHAAYLMSVGSKNKVPIKIKDLKQIWYDSLSGLTLDSNTIYSVVANVKESTKNLKGVDKSTRESYLKTVNWAFNQAGLMGEISVMGKVKNQTGQLIPEYKIGINKKNAIKYLKQEYVATIYFNNYVDESTTATLTFSADDYISESYSINLGNCEYLPVSIDAILKPLKAEKIETGNIGGQVFHWMKEDYTTEGIEVHIYNYEHNYTTVIDGKSCFEFNDIPEGTYNILIEDERKLEYEGTRCGYYFAEIYVSKDNNEYLELYLNPYYDIYRGYLNIVSDGIKIPLKNERITIKRKKDNLLWFTDVSDENGHYYCPKGDDVYEVYLSDGSYVYSYGG